MMKKLLAGVALAGLVLAGCSESPKPTPPKPAVQKTTPNVTYTPRHKTTNTVAPKPTSKMFKTCREAFDARHVPVYKGEPEYNPKLDGDHDGLACEH